MNLKNGITRDRTGSEGSVSRRVKTVTRVSDAVTDGEKVSESEEAGWLGRFIWTKVATAAAHFWILRSLGRSRQGSRSFNRFLQRPFLSLSLSLSSLSYGLSGRGCFADRSSSGASASSRKADSLLFSSFHYICCYLHWLHQANDSCVRWALLLDREFDWLSQPGHCTMREREKKSDLTHFTGKLSHFTLIFYAHLTWWLFRMHRSP